MSSASILNTTSSGFDPSRRERARTHLACSRSGRGRRLVALVLLTGCASTGAPRAGQPVPQPDAPLLAAEISDTDARTAYEAISRLRPHFLSVAEHGARGAANVNETAVFVDGVRLGGASTLSSIPTRAIRSIRFVKPMDTTIQLGPWLSGGAILIETVP
jgi:hypothetical protein